MFVSEKLNFTQYHGNRVFTRRGILCPPPPPCGPAPRSSKKACPRCRVKNEKVHDRAERTSAEDCEVTSAEGTVIQNTHAHVMMCRREIEVGDL